MTPLLLDRVRAIAADVLAVPIDDIRPDSTRDTLPGWDSLHHVNLVLGLEQEFDLQFTPDDMNEMLSIELVVLLVQEKLAHGDGAGA